MNTHTHSTSDHAHFTLGAFAWIALTLATLASSARGEVDFTRDVRPILSDKCFFCHGPDKKNQKSKLRLDNLKDATAKTTESGFPAIVPGKPDDSELVFRINSDDKTERMPPAKTKLSLTAAEKQILTDWIKEGATYQQHWSFEPVGDVKAPAVDNSKWPRNAVDHFVLARLQKAKLSPSPEASREHLIRRLCFDLTGLPPTPEEVDAFVNDTSGGAYETLVDRLLAEQTYGERMATDWLDVARYSDSYGYQVDRDRFVWPWRDWVIKAFNSNMPFDQFVTEQLAGDLLPNATSDQILATTFNRLHPQKVEGGSTPEEFRVEYVADRTHTFGTAFLGIALECCRCHEHKYDPITQTEYYQLFAFFNNIDEAGLYSYFTPAVPTPTLMLTSDNDGKKLSELEGRIKALESRSTKHNDSAAFTKWLATKPTPTVTGQVEHQSFEKHKGGANKSVAGPVGKAIQLSGDDQFGLKTGNFRRTQPFSVSLWMNTPDVKDRAVVFHRSRAWTDAGSRGYQLLIEAGKLSWSLIHFWPGNAMRIRTVKPIATNKWLNVTVTNDGSSRASGLAIHIDGQRAETEIVRDKLTKTITGGGGNNISIGARMRDRGFTNGMVDEFKVFKRELTPIEIAHLHDGKSLTAAAGRDQLAAYHRSAVDAEYGKQLAELQKLRDEHTKTLDRISEIMVMRELKKTRPTYFLRRGAYDMRGDRVDAGTPSAFSPFSKDLPRNRLGLARWLTDPQHPLTARVFVNRLWQMCFGEGLVRTPEDFGSQGQLPTHPKLLDYLSKDFMDHGWNIKRTVKTIVMSATYRQSSQPTQELVQRDPENRLLGRAPRHRLSAEMLRDNALAASDLLVKTIGGAPVKPYEVEVSFKPLKRDRGQGLYRRSLYTYWKRTAPAPVMMSLDASKRDVCRVRRERTSSPLQALVLMNSPQFVEAARQLAQRTMKAHKADDERIVRLFRVLTSRKPSDKEKKLLLDLLRDRTAWFKSRPDLSKSLLATGDAPVDKSLAPEQLAAMTMVASTVMNLDDCVTKR